MNCPNDGTQMETGFFTAADGIRWVSNNEVADKMDAGMVGKFVYGYHCPKCGKVELTTNVEK